jgi:hypothetical protein
MARLMQLIGSVCSSKFISSAILRIVHRCFGILVALILLVVLSINASRITSSSLLNTAMSLKENDVSKTLKFGIIVLVIFCLVLVVITLLDIPLAQRVSGLPAREEATPVIDISDQNPDLVAAVNTALADAGGRWEVYDYEIDHIQVQDDGLQAIVWLAAIDLETGELVGREPELALAEKSPEGGWDILLEDNSKFTETFKSFQYAQKSVQGDILAEDDAQPKSTRVFGGYYLPWAKDLTKRLTWSVGHTSCYPTYYCTYAFDFADGTMFPLVAAKGGTVYHWRDTCANGDSSCTNSITLEDRSTTPWTYQIYLHIAQNSIPASLKKVGTPVMQGQYIADVDDTGYSTGHHVHFMVVAAETRYTSVSGYVWGVAEDITYRDVTINWDAATQGGRPRLAYEAATYGGVGQTYYTSGNKPANPPTGGLTAPANMTYATAPLTVAGWGDDDIAVTKMEVLANYNGNWVHIGSDQTANPFSTSIDLCKTSVPDGPFWLAMRVWDYEGNPSGIIGARKVIKDVDCGTSGSDPVVNLTLNGGVLALPQSGFVSATASKGSTGAAIVSVDFWLHLPDWVNNQWVNLGKDTNGTNGWQAPITTTGMLEGNQYTVMAVVTDSLGSTDASVNFQSVVDRTAPVAAFESISSPVKDSTVTLRWTASDNLSGLGGFSLAVSVNGSEFLPVVNNLPGDTRSYQVSVSKNSMYNYVLTAYDKSGNAFIAKTILYTEGYDFPEGYIFPLFYSGD